MRRPRLVAILTARVLGDRLLLALVVMLPVMLWLVPPDDAGAVAEVFRLIDDKTVAALAGLMVLSRALEVSGLLDRAGRALARRLRSLRGLALALCGFAALLSAVVTNDVALFITVPLTLALARGQALRQGAGQGVDGLPVQGLPVGRLVVFQALAVNAGSALSPVGNPQNLFLWQVSGVGPLAFAGAMAPLVAGMGFCLAALVWLAFPARAVAPSAGGPPAPVNRWLAGAGLAAYPAFLAAVGLGWAGAAAAVAILAFGLAGRATGRAVLGGVDWLLLLVFALMFVNLGLLAQLPAVAALVPGAEAALPGGMMTLSALVSQGMSNVPAAIFLAPFADDWRALAWGVSIGGFGLAIGSLANLIALRLVRMPGLWRDFHRWSVAMFLLSLLLGLLLAP